MSKPRLPKTHKRDKYFADQAMCGAKPIKATGVLKLSDTWATVDCGNCLSWRAHSES